MGELSDPHLDVVLGVEYGADPSFPLDLGWSVDISQSLEIPQIEHTDSHVWIGFAQEPELSVLPGDEPLPHCRQLEIQVVLREIEVRRDELYGSPIPAPPHRERCRLICPSQPIERQESGQLDLGRVSEAMVIRLEQPSQRRQELLTRRFIKVERRAFRFIGSIQALIDAAQAWKSGCPGHGLPAPRANTRPVTGRCRDGR
jgi:hypothetical protein